MLIMAVTGAEQLRSGSLAVANSRFLANAKAANQRKSANDKTGCAGIEPTPLTTSQIAFG
jgi:hypothetical protein